MASAGRLYIESVDDIANATASDYRNGTLVWDIANSALYCVKAGAFKAVTVAV